MAEKIQSENISEAALARKKAFKEAKEKAGGANQLILQNKKKQYKVYFDQVGTILALTSEKDFKPDPEWLTYDFRQDQLQVLIDNPTDAYEVVKDEQNDKNYYIRIKPIETAFVDVNDEFLTEIHTEKKRGWNIQVELTKTQLKVAISKATLKQYEGIYPISATVKGQRLLRFYITAPNDPHTMFGYHIVPLADLISDGGVQIDTPYDFREYSIYTSKLFDIYVRK